MKKILGLDLGTNSIGWAVVNATTENNAETISGIDIAGSRIIPTDADILGKFDSGASVSQTANRTKARGARRLRERYLLRRERLLRVLALMDFLPQHYATQIDRLGKFINDSEPKLAWKAGLDNSPVFLFKDSFNEMLKDFPNMKVPYDWTIYYLRKKALSQPITKEELAWILLNFNQKRGYYQPRQEEEESDKIEEYQALKVSKVEATAEKKGDNVWYNVYFENSDIVYRRSSSIYLDWEGKIKNLIITTKLDKDGKPKKDKEGNIIRSLRAPKEDDWTLVKKKTEHDIDISGKTVGCYIYDTLVANPSAKITGGLVQTIERKYYKDELRRILEAQKQYIPELSDRELYTRCVENLYPNNPQHCELIAKRDFTALFIDDILFYQRPLKSKKSLIDECQYEKRSYLDKENHTLKSVGVKCVSKSHPRFQEFRLWQFISNLRLYERQKWVGESLKADVDVTGEFLSTEADYERLFNYLNTLKSIKQDTLLKSFLKSSKKVSNYRWNYVEDKEYPCNETRAMILLRLKKLNITGDFLTLEVEEALWHILYSVSDKAELRKALRSFAQEYKLDAAAFSDLFCKFPPFKGDYGAYSLKAINKLLPLMRRGGYWSADAIDIHTKERIDKIINGEYDPSIKDYIREKLSNLTDIEHFKGLPVWLACYVVYGRHSEASEIQYWKKPEDIDTYLKGFKQHSLRNPIVEQVITETLRVVRDIWRKVGHIDEIHVELGREMKNPAEKRKKMSAQMAENETTNLRIKALLTEFMNPDMKIEGVRPYSPSQQEILRIYEDGVLNGKEEIAPDIQEIIDKFKQSDIKKYPSHAEVVSYKLWLDQKYRSPYTGRIIPLSRLFTTDYEIEHIIPQSRYFDDSFSNKVICEAAVNKLKDNMLGHEFIVSYHGKPVKLSNGKTVEILELQEYEKLVIDNYSSDKSKMKKLLMDDIPDGFIQRQLNDSRYISKVIKGLLSNIVREDGEEEATSKNVIVCAGSVTDRLKKDWGANDKWNEIILPRFERMNSLVADSKFTAVSQAGHLIPAMPLEYQKGFNKKRIDHRHHAMDAVIIACANRNIVNYLNNASAQSNSKTTRYDLQRLLCHKTKTDENGNYKWVLNMPWDSFPQDLYAALSDIVVSFKQNIRVINKTSNKIQKVVDGKRVMVAQTKGGSWAIRKSLHQDHIYGEVNLQLIKPVALKIAITKPNAIAHKELREKIIELLALNYDLKQIQTYFDNNKEVWSDIDLKNINIRYFSKDTDERYFAIRQPIDDKFDRKKIASITDSGIRKILLKHLEQNGDDPKIAFSPDGVEKMNKNIIALNNGKNHQPIYKVRWYEKASKFQVGTTGNKKKKFTEADKGTNLFFAVYEDKNHNRKFASIPFNVAIQKQKSGQPLTDSDGIIPTFILSPGDLVYLPKKCETVSLATLDKDRIYKMVSCDGTNCFFIKQSVAIPIIDKVEFESHNKIGRAPTGEMIKETCLPLKVDRLGSIIKVGI